MSEAKSVEKAVETAAKVADSAVALTEPTTAPAAVAKASWWATQSRKRLAMFAGGAAIVLGGGGYGYKYFTAQPSTAAAQTNPPAVAEAKPEATPPVRSTSPAEELPDIKPPTLKPPAPAGDIDVPLVKPPVPNKPDTAPPPPIPSIDIELTPIKPPMPVKNDNDVPTLVIPPSPTAEKKEKKPEAIDSEIFKAPDPLPTAVKDKTDKSKESAPVIRIGGTETNPVKKEEPPAVPDIDIKIPPPPPPVPTKKEEPPAIPDIDVKIPPAPMPMKTEESKTGPAPKIEVPPPPPVVDVPPPTIKAPTIPDVPPSPPIRVDVPTPMPRVDVPPPPLIDNKKKDMYDEDWHSQREGDTYTIISKEYYKTADYAQALEAYNKDRRKPGERIVRVPPTWVLEEQFPNLSGPKAEKPEVPDAKSPSGVKFEPASSPSGGGRPAPPPAVGAVGTVGAVANDEYKVKAEAGETIREIARKVYGSPESWKKLWDMNPNLDPTQPIPNGTTLRLGR